MDPYTIFNARHPHCHPFVQVQHFTLKLLTNLFQLKHHTTPTLSKQTMSFKLPYVFKVDGKEVVIQNKAGGDFDKFLRVKPGDLGKPDSQGGQGEFARFIVEFDNGDSSKVRLKSKKTGKYLRIMKDDEINVEGGTGPLTLFKVQKQGEANLVKLESNKFAGS